MNRMISSIVKFCIYAIPLIYSISVNAGTLCIKGACSTNTFILSPSITVGLNVPLPIVQPVQFHLVSPPSIIVNLHLNLPVIQPVILQLIPEHRTAGWQDEFLVPFTAPTVAMPFAFDLDMRGKAINNELRFISQSPRVSTTGLVAYNVSSVPEPGVWMLMSIGMILIFIRSAKNDPAKMSAHTC